MNISDHISESLEQGSGSATLLLSMPLLTGQTVRRLAGARLQAVLTGRRKELLLAAVSLESLVFLIWRHLEHFLLYSSAALAATPATPYQVLYSVRHLVQQTFAKEIMFWNRRVWSIKRVNVGICSMGSM
jgi:hypothetical protein